MKKISLLAIMLLLAMFAMAQSSIIVKFTAEDQNGNFFQLDAVKVTSISQSWNQTLAYPDTTLILYYTDGVSEFANEGGLSQNKPNPFYGSTEADLVVTEGGDALLRLIRLDGKVIAERSANLEAGEHRINVTLADVQMAFLHVATANHSYAIKLLNLGRGGANSIEVNHVVKRGEKPTKAVGAGPFELGDLMSYTGIVMQNGNMVNSNTVTQTQYNSEDITLVFNIEVPTDPQLPVVTTANLSNISNFTAQCGGNVLSDGNAAVTARGVCWSTSPNPTTANPKTIDGSGLGSFTSTLTGLAAGTTYYVRAYATNAVGTAYGEERVLTTLVETTLPVVTTAQISDIANYTASCGGNVLSDGNAAVTVRGVCWSTSPNPTTANPKTIDGSGLGSFTSTLTGLAAGTTYYVRAYATNSLGTAYGEERVLTTLVETTLPVVTTAQISDITNYTASCGGNVLSDGNAAVTARGVCWSTSPNPTTANPKTIDGSGLGSFTSTLTGLAAGTTYYVRAYATNSVGTAYGEERVFTTLVVNTLPTVITAQVSEISNYTAQCGGEVISDGNLAVTARGVCWSTSPSPTISNPKTTDGSGIGSFTSTLTGLTEGTTYYVRAYATNSMGTAYGEERSFTTATPAVTLPTVITAEISNINYSTATCGGNVTNSGGGSVMVRGVCWSTGQNPTITDSKTTDGSGMGVFASAMTELLPGTTYYVRAYATNGAGTGYGDIVTFTTTQLAKPTVNTSEISGITGSSAVCGGVVTSDGGAEVTARGVCWSTSQNPTTSNSKTIDGTGTGSFTSSITNLAEGTTYYVRAYAINSVGTSYGEQKTFTTITTNTLTVITAEVSDVTTTTATCGGNVTNDGGSIVIARGVCWSVTPIPTISDSKTTDGYNTGVFTSAITGLASGTTYYVRAYATNSSETAYGEIKIFTTESEALPTVITAEVSNVTASTATCGGTVTVNGSIAATTRGVCWSTTPDPTIANSKTTDGSGAGTFTSSITGLTAATLYYVRAYAEYTGGGAVYGETKIFMTNPTLPTVITNNVSDVTQTTAVCGGNVTYDGGASVMARGVCWSTSSNPTINDSHTTDGSGTGGFTSNITGLAYGTAYYVRAYATNSVGTAYGTQKLFRAGYGDVPVVGALNALYSVSATAKVYFSQGNLQYQASTGTWRFAESQTNFVGSANSNISTTYTGWIDLFGWGTGTNPTNNSSSVSDWSSFRDWGNRPISNGGNTAYQWHTLSKDNWNYLLFTRSTSSGIRYAKARVNGVNGLIILPDDWSTDYYTLNSTNTASASFSTNTITSADWMSIFEVHGVVFLPAAGYRNGTSVSGGSGCYWSSTSYGTVEAYGLYFSGSSLSVDYDHSARNIGQSVRLVRY